MFRDRLKTKAFNETKRNYRNRFLKQVNKTKNRLGETVSNGL